ncbi:MAG: Brp/Blh family beta-carotene 15,15'-dioxygenase [Planctomycetota bacterium]
MRSAADLIARYTWLVGAATLVFCGVVLLVGPPSPRAAAVTMLVAVGLLGLPHGSYDLEIGRRLFSKRLGGSWWLAFGAAYLVCALLALGFWIVAPWLGLTLLLVGGALHWGADDLEATTGSPRTRAWLAASRGAIPVAGPLLFAPGEVATIFASLVGQSEVSARWTVAAGGVVLLLALPGLIRIVALTRRTNPGAAWRSVLEPAALLALCAAVSPTLAFTVYFCFWHAVRHSIRSAANADPAKTPPQAARAYLLAVAVPTVLTWALGAVAWLTIETEPLTVPATWRLVFVGLFALTVPHVVLEWIENRTKYNHLADTACRTLELQQEP